MPSSLYSTDEEYARRTADAKNTWQKGIFRAWHTPHTRGVLVPALTLLFFLGLVRGLRKLNENIKFPP